MRWILPGVSSSTLANECMYAVHRAAKPACPSPRSRAASSSSVLRHAMPFPFEKLDHTVLAHEVQCTDDD